MTFLELRTLLSADFDRRSALEFFRIFKYLFSRNPSKRSVTRVRMAQFLYTHGFKRPANFLLSGLMNGLGVHVAVTARIGAGLKLPHANSVVIGLGIVIGKRCTIYQQTTIAGAPTKPGSDFQRLGDDVIVYPGAKVVGLGTVGNNVIIGANTVVTKAFGDNVVLAGAPARVIRKLDPI